MENGTLLLKAIADDTRLNMLELLLNHHYCVGALARRLKLTEAAISQHLKVLREAGLIIGEKRGYFIHYSVNRGELKKLAQWFDELASTQTKECRPDEEDCTQKKQGMCHVHQSGGECSEETRLYCHGQEKDGKDSGRGNCGCHHI